MYLFLIQKSIHLFNNAIQYIRDNGVTRYFGTDMINIQRLDCNILINFINARF